MLVELKKFYRGKKVLITGHTGFKGTWLLCTLHSLGAVVKGYALEPYNKDDIYNATDADSLCISVIEDIRNKELIAKEVLNFEPDLIFHLAAQPLVLESYKNPSYTYEVNVLGTAYLLDAILNLKKTVATVIITTDKVYKNFEWDFPYREVDILGGYDPYSSSKSACEILVESYRKSYFNDNAQINKGIATARAGNVIGGGDWSKNRLIPDIIKSVKNNDEIEIRNPNSVRPWQHVLEPISGYLLLGMKLFETPFLYNEAWNFGPYQFDNLTVNDIVNKVIEIWGNGSYRIKKQNGKPNEHEAKLLSLDISKSINRLNWKPKWDASTAINATIEWYKSSEENQKEITFRQIENYLSA